LGGALWDVDNKFEDMAASIVTFMVNVFPGDINRAFGIGSRDGQTHVERISSEIFVDNFVLLELGLGDTMAFDFNPEGSNGWGAPLAVDNIPEGHQTLGQVASGILEIVGLVSSLGIQGISLHGPNKRERDTSSIVYANNRDGINSIGSKIAKELIRCRGRNSGCSSSCRCVGD